MSWSAGVSIVALLGAIFWYRVGSAEMAIFSWLVAACAFVAYVMPLSDSEDR